MNENKHVETQTTA